MPETTIYAAIAWCAGGYLIGSLILGAHKAIVRCNTCDLIDEGHCCDEVCPYV